MQTEKEIIRNILTHRYFVQGNCIECGKPFETFTNSNGMRSSCCSDRCYKEFRSEQIKRGKARHHYEVFKSGRYYYIKTDGVFDAKRTLGGKSWVLERHHPLDTTPLLNPQERIPEKAIKIIDKVSAYLYDEQHPFKVWKTLGVAAELPSKPSAFEDDIKKQAKWLDEEYKKKQSL